MADESKNEPVAQAMRQINKAWLGGRMEELGPLLHPNVVMVLPGFEGRIQGRDAVLAGFRDFCEQARIEEFRDRDYYSEVLGETAIVTFRYEMTYQRASSRYRGSGRDFWIFQKSNATWLAVWRTMLDIHEETVQAS